MPGRLQLNIPATVDPLTATAADRIPYYVGGVSGAVYRTILVKDLITACNAANGIFPWTPASISNLDAWWVPTPTTTGTTVGLPVTSLADSAAGGLYPAEQATAGKKPVLTADGGNYYLQLDGVDDYLEVASLPARADYFIWAVYAWDYAINAGGSQRGGIWGREQGSIVSRSALSVQNNGVGRVQHSGYNSFDGADNTDGRTRAAGGKSLALCTFVNSGGTTTRTYTTPTLGSTLTGSGSSSLSEGDGTFYLGYNNAAGEAPFGGRIYEIGRTNGAISGGDLTELLAYADAKYGSLI